MTGAARTALPIVSMATFVIVAGAILASAGDTLGYDFRAYLGAAERLRAGLPMYDPGVDVAGGFAIYLYPPPVAVAFLPFTLLPPPATVVIWEAMTVAALIAAIGLMPVRSTVRWLVVLLAAIDWPVLYALKLGQVGPWLLLLFVVGWRWIDRPVPLGLSMAAGATLKVQPLLLLGWAALTRRWLAVVWAIGGILATAVAATVVVGPDAWADYVSLLGRVSAPVTTPHNFTVGAVLFQAGVPEATADLAQLASMVIIVGIVAVAALRTSSTASYVTAAVATQALSPVLWDHYAVVLLLPVAWLLDRGYAWAVLIPLATSLPLIGLMPAAVYPIVFAVGLVAAPFVDAWHRPRTGAAASDGASVVGAT